MLIPRYLAGIVDLPYVTAAGRVVMKPGYDAETCTYLEVPRDRQIVVPESPTPEQVRAALEVMMAPWSAYGFSDTNSAGGAVSAVLAAVCRSSLDLCPAYLWEASQQGSGKTKAATALGAVIEGRRPAVTPFAATSSDDELRKRLLASVIAGDRFTCLDNVTGHLKSAALSAALTGGWVKDRDLGFSRMAEGAVRSLMTLTGNNASLDADLMRRTVTIRIDGGVNPTQRAFRFCPVSEALTHRRAIAEAACTVLCAYFAAGAPDIVAGDAGGWTSWARLCRQPVLWLAREGLADGLPWHLSDPAFSMLADPSEGDPEIEATSDLMRALNALSEGADFTVAEALKWVNAGEHDDEGAAGLLRSAVLECTGKLALSARSMGHVLKFRRDRPVHGLKLLARAGGSKFKTWRVVHVDQPDRTGESNA